MDSDKTLTDEGILADDKTITVDNREKPVYFVLFPQNTPVVSLLPRNYRAEGIIGGITEAAALFSRMKGKPAGQGDVDEEGNEIEAGEGPQEAESVIAVVNCLDYYRNVSALRKEPDLDLIRQLSGLKENREDLGIRLLMPEGKNTDQNLLIELMSRGFFDFWFLAALNKALLAEILGTRRDFRAMEAYLSMLPPSAASVREGKSGGWASRLLTLSPGEKNGADKMVDGLINQWFAKLKIFGSKESRRAGEALAPGESIRAPDGFLHSPEALYTEEAGNGTRGGLPSDGDRVVLPEADYAVDFHAALKSLAGWTGRFRSQAAAGGAGGKRACAESFTEAESQRARAESFTEAEDRTAYTESGTEAESQRAHTESYAEAEGQRAYTESGTEAEKSFDLIPAQAGAQRGAPGGLIASLKSFAGHRGGAKRFKLKAAKGRRAKSAADPPGDTALFYSDEDSLLPYALAFLTAGFTASRGDKTLLVELPGSGSRLAVALGLRHPERHLSGALRGYVSGERGEWRKYCFSGPEFYGDPRSFDRTGFSRRLPPQLYFLPDSRAEEALYASWDGFSASLIHWAVMEERFSYIIYVGFGGREPLCWKDGLACRHKIIVFPPWPGGFNEASVLEARWQKGCLPAFDGSWGMKYIKNEVKSLKLKEYLVVPGTVKEDFIQMASFQRGDVEYSPESLQCLHDLWDTLNKAQAPNRADGR